VAKDAGLMPEAILDEHDQLILLHPALLPRSRILKEQVSIRSHFSYELFPFAVNKCNEVARRKPRIDNNVREWNVFIQRLSNELFGKIDLAAKPIIVFTVFKLILWLIEFKIDGDMLIAIDEA